MNAEKIFTLTIYTILLTSILLSCGENANHSTTVKNITELNEAIQKAQPGEVITLANGVWKDIEIVFSGKGTKEAPIRLIAEEFGKVFIEGQSNLSLSGEYLEVSGLIFRNGFTPSSEVISFRTSEKELANHSRVSDCVIDDFSNIERYDVDTWVAIYGRNNRFDHNSMINKRNKGVTLAVRLNTEESQENNHIIEYNYFGPRQVLASNGGETLRIGTSHYSLTNSITLVQFNYFDRCSGELEIISNKSCKNTFKGNVFYQCKGTLTMRHGKYTLVEGNYFLGGGKPNTGGIRVINEYQIVRNNYMQGLTGYRFRGPLVIMNGVPNSPANRYNQVIDSKIEGNILVNCDNVQLCAGSDEERSAVPIGTTFASNIFMSKMNRKPFVVYDDISGIAFQNNFINEEITPPLDNGFKQVSFELTKNENGLNLPSSELLKEIDFTNPKLPISKEEVGASFYPKAGNEVTFGSQKEILVVAGTNTILDAVAQSKPGDVLLLENGKEYLLTKDVLIPHVLTIKAKRGEKPMILSGKSAFFKIENGGSLSLENLEFNGSQSPDQPGNSVVSTSKYAMNKNYKFFVRNCEISDLDVNHSFDFLRIYRSTMADSVLIENSDFKNITGNILSMARETDDLGMYNVERLIISESRFEKIGGMVAYIYRGGTDESTFGPIVRLKNSEFIEVGNDKRNKAAASLKFHGVQNLLITDCKWKKSAPLNLHLTNGEPISNIHNCTFENTGEIVHNRKAFNTENIQLVN
ncbi:MAG: chondroitinase-B domain-containing protein [Bacteroidota bacterium]